VNRNSKTDRLAMGAPTSAIISEAYIQNMEHKQIYPILVKCQITGYFRYCDGFPQGITVTSDNSVGNVHIQWKRNKKNY
jgi:hypothetical protein